MADLTKQEATESDRDAYMSELAEQSFARQYFQYARYKTREHDKIELTAGLIVGVVFALIFGSGSWLSTAVIGLLAFGATLIMIFLLHWLRAPSAFHKRAIADSKRGNKIDQEGKRREVLILRLTDLIKEAGEVNFGAVSMSSIEGMGKVWRQSAYHDRAKNFVNEHYGPETASRYDKEKSNLLEELLADCYREKDETKPDISGAIEEVIEKKLLPSRDSSVAGFDYYFTLRFWLRNTGAHGNFQNFTLSIFVDNKVYTGEMLSLSGCCLYKQSPQQTGAHTELERVQERLQDFDGLTPLEPNNSRPGWLRFVVRNVVWNQNDDAANYISHMELRVTDGSGGQRTITDKPPWRQENSNLEVRKCPTEW